MKTLTQRRATATATELWALIAGGAVLVVGVFADGRAHSTSRLETFITPAHTVVFAGYLLTVAVIVAAIRARIPGRQSPWSAVPDGWRQAVWGVLVFGAAFVGDGVWHTIFGIEADLEALLSPTHLAMLAGGTAVLVTPVIAQWRNPEAGPRTPSQAVVATVLVSAVVSFFLFWMWPLANEIPAMRFTDFLTDAHAIAGYLIFGILMPVPLVVLSRRWQLPPGAAAAILLVPAMGMLYAFDLASSWPRLASIAAGAALVEAAAARSVLTADRWRWLAPAMVVSVWGLDMLIIHLRRGLAWPAEFVAGSVLLAGVAAVAVVLLLTLPEGPD